MSDNQEIEVEEMFNDELEQFYAEREIEDARENALLDWLQDYEMANKAKK